MFDHAYALAGPTVAHGFDIVIRSELGAFDLNRQLERLEHSPSLSARLARHVDETKMQIQRLEQILDDLAEDHSPLNDAAMSLVDDMARSAMPLLGMRS